MITLFELNCNPNTENIQNIYDEMLKEKRYISVNDPACGAGAMLIAFANMAKKHGINYQKHVLFVAQDIDRTAAMMCYIQMSLLGCSAVIVIGDSKTISDSLQSHFPIQITKCGIHCFII